jgi:hypothetical protein
VAPPQQQQQQQQQPPPPPPPPPPPLETVMFSTTEPYPNPYNSGSSLIAVGVFCDTKISSTFILIHLRYNFINIDKIILPLHNYFSRKNSSFFNKKHVFVLKILKILA